MYCETMKFAFVYIFAHLEMKKITIFIKGRTRDVTDDRHGGIIGRAFIRLVQPKVRKVRNGVANLNVKNARFMKYPAFVS